ncbi:hypothetical protein CPSG_04772 [Coccidioides posadasii str. Silveira]|uniref:Uncharacterized protein n=1 Tax=Coccidioides posadasii (strain RMSCC 757 / Silveira) TaxID=443226 RepID=E9D592_COCPS|nr:hypothetical protein CPSG_04772 [Coccidioides posadasii str. Silveira]
MASLRHVPVPNSAPCQLSSSPFIGSLSSTKQRNPFPCPVSAYRSLSVDTMGGMGLSGTKKLHHQLQASLGGRKFFKFVPPAACLSAVSIWRRATEFSMRLGHIGQPPCATSSSRLSQPLSRERAPFLLCLHRDLFSLAAPPISSQFCAPPDFLGDSSH